MWALGIIPALGISLACSTLVVQNIGARNPPRAVPTASEAVGTSFGGLPVVGLPGYPAAGPLVQFFLEGDEAVSRHAVEFVRIAVYSLCFAGAQQSASGALRGAGHTLSATMLAIIGVWVVRVPVA